MKSTNQSLQRFKQQWKSDALKCFEKQITRKLNEEKVFHLNIFKFEGMNVRWYLVNKITSQSWQLIFIIF